MYQYAILASIDKEAPETHKQIMNFFKESFLMNDFYFAFSFIISYFTLSFINHCDYVKEKVMYFVPPKKYETFSKIEFFSNRLNSLNIC